jgi:ATPase family protein associated with various cellular activities (AAA)/winged helix domain-containing protein
VSDESLLARLRALADRQEPPALERLASGLGLSAFERRLIMLCFALETDAQTAMLIAEASGERQALGIPVALAQLVLEAEEWTATSPAGTLRRWHILEAGAPAPRTQLRLRLADAVTDALLGIFALDTQLVPVMQPLRDGVAATPALIRDVASVLARRGVDGLSPVVLGGWPDGPQVAAAVSLALGMQPYVIDASRLAASGERLPSLQRLWERDLLLRPALAVAEAPSDPVSSTALGAFLTGLAGHAIVLGNSAPLGLRRETDRVALPRVPVEETASLWRTALGPSATQKLNGSVERAAAHFDLAPAAIAAAAARSRSAIESAPDAASAERAFWAACGRAAWPDPGPLASVIEPRAEWDDLVVPPAVREDLDALVRHVRHSAVVFEQWGFSGRSERGRGLIALFAGPSGTGKTLAAECIAGVLGLPLVRADFSQLQSKWVGESSKLAARLFDEVEAGGAVLLIDEADGLLGRRGLTSDAHPHWNAEVGYFLQRLEVYRGLAILTTNMKSAIDEAFLRRFRFVVDFPMPAVAERERIWRRVFPPGAPLDGVDPSLLARLPLAGGAIRNVALNAAFIAAEANSAITTAHVVTALRAEYRKLERPPGEIDFGVLA